MKVKINEFVIENINEELSTSYRFAVEKELSDATTIYNTIKDLSIFELDYLSENDSTIGVYTNKKLKKMEYENGIATFFLIDVDMLEQQVDQNKADIEYIMLAQEL